MQENLRSLGDSLDIALVGEGARYWGILEKVERKLNPNAPRPVMAGLVGARAVSALWAVLCRELSRRPLEFTTTIQSFAGAIVKEVGSVLSVMPFEMRVEAYEALTALLAQGLDIAVAAEAAERANPEEHS